MTFEIFRKFKVVASAIFAVGLIGGMPIAATADVSYPWCSQGDTLRCNYSTHAQCEETVDYRGFCVANPEFQTQTSEAVRSSLTLACRGHRPRSEHWLIGLAK
jgi:hypothetical protein